MELQIKKPKMPPEIGFLNRLGTAAGMQIVATHDMKDTTLVAVGWLTEWLIKYGLPELRRFDLIRMGAYRKNIRTRMMDPAAKVTPRISYASIFSPSWY